MSSGGWSKRKLCERTDCRCDSHIQDEGPSGVSSPTGQAPPRRDELDSFEISCHEASIEQEQEQHAQSSLGRALPSSSSSRCDSLVVPHLVNSGGSLTTGVAVKLNPLHAFLGHDAKFLNERELRDRLGITPSPSSRPSILNALAFKCKQKACNGQCSKKLEEVNLRDLRQIWTADLIMANYNPNITKDAVLNTFIQHFIPNEGGKTAYFKDVTVRIENPDGSKQDVQICIATWAICVANFGKSTLEKTRAEVPRLVKERSIRGTSLALFKSGSNQEQLLLGQPSKTSNERNDSQKFKLVVGYVKDFCSTLEHSPVPGACRLVEYIAPRETWGDRLDQCIAHFKEKEIDLTISRKLFTQAWRSVAHLIDKAMKSHSKCDICARFDAVLCSLVGKTDDATVQLRKELRKLKAEHRKLHAIERSELDDAGYRSIVYPAAQLTLIADGATQRNFLLPKLRARTPKCLATATLFCSKLYGVFIYGYGMNCYLVHESVGGGANLSCTCIYLAIRDAIRSGRPLPEELHFQLDNTSAENKCIIMFCFAAWLVKKRWAKRVRIFFLGKGHTHVIIDQAFGSITKFVRSRSVFTPQQLLKCIQDVLQRSRTYSGKTVQRLHHLYDWSSFFHGQHTNLGGFHTGAFNETGYHDFVVSINDAEDAVLNMKKYASTPDWCDEAEGGFCIFKAGAFDELKDKSPHIFDLKGDTSWDRDDFIATQRNFEQYFALDQTAIDGVRQQWEEALDDTADSTSALKPSNLIAFEELDDGLEGSLRVAQAVTTHAPSLLTYSGAQEIANPPVCTVHGAHRSAGVVKRAIEAWLVKRRGSIPISTTPLSTVSLYSTDFILVDRGANTPGLFSISKRCQPHLPPQSPSVDVRCFLYTTSMAPQSGFFGDYKRTETLKVVTRAEILVYNVTFMKSQGKTKQRYLSVETLEALRDVRPQFVEQLDEAIKSHPVYMPKATAPTRGANRKPAVRHRPLTDSSDEDDLSDEDEDENDLDSSDEVQDVDPEENPENDIEGNEDSFQLTGTRKAGDYVWIDLEGDADMKGYTYQIGVAECTKDEVERTVDIGWMAPIQWKGKTLSKSNNTYTTYWDKQNEEHVQVTQTVEVKQIVSVRINILSHQKAGGITTESRYVPIRLKLCLIGSNVKHL